MFGGVISIEDLGSTNGTFVNGEKIMKAQLKEGDRVLIGTSILKVVPIGTDDAVSRRNLESVAVRRVTSKGRGAGYSSDEAPRMTGNLEEIPLPDLLQLFSTSRKNGVLVVRTDSRVGRIFMKNGLLHQVLIDGQPGIPPLKAIYRMLNWHRGFFELDPPDPRHFENPLDATAQEVLMEGFRQLDEFAVLQQKLPPFEARLLLKTPLKAPLHQLDGKHLEILQQAINAPNLDTLFDISQYTDFETGQIVVELMQRGYLMAGR